MARDGKVDKQQTEDLLITRLVKEAEISEQQARELIALIGTEWSSLIREARFLKNRN
jgi:hypothetical protein